MAWTKEQENAIKKTGNNILVSAGAGSGKTAVLTERIVEHIKNGVDISSLLVLTFTKDAAKEMKERVRKKLIENNLQEAILKLDTCYITTFDSYCLSLVKKYYYRLGITNKIEIIDNILISQVKKEIIEEELLNLYEKKDQAFFDLLTTYAEKDDYSIKSLILEIIDGFDLMANPHDYVLNYESLFYSNKSYQYLISLYEKIVHDQAEIVIDAYYSLINELGEDELNISAHDLLSDFVNDLCLSNTYNEYRKTILDFPTYKIKKRDDLKDLKTLCKNEFDALKKLVDDYSSTDDMIERILSTKSYSCYLMNLSYKIFEKIQGYKFEKNLFQFTDIARLAIKAVTDFKEVREEVSNSFTEILIDEYQDTSDLQEALIGLITNNNVYMVGDIKQSIYRFRNANPSLFKEKFTCYGKSNGGERIDLLKNFRSRSEVIDNINYMFNQLMTEDYGEADYKKNNQMVFGQIDYLKNTSKDNYEMEVLHYNNEDKEYLDLEIEAFTVGNDIKKKLGNMSIMDKKGNFHKAKYSDFCILIDRNTKFNDYKKIFEYLGIPLSINANFDLKNSYLVNIIANILTLISKLINNEYDKEFKHAFVSIARSFLFEYTDSKILELLNTDIFSDEIIILAKNIIKKDQFCKEIYDDILIEYKVFEKLPLIGDIESCLVELEYIGKMLSALSSVKDLKSAITLIKEALDSDQKLEYSVDDSSGDKVKIMNIHKSKGLEFPVCYFSMLGVAFNNSEEKKTMGFNKDFGVYMPFYSDEGFVNTIVKDTINYVERCKDISEKIRLFYVAVTRAREKIIILSKDTDYKPKYLKPNNFNCFNHMIKCLKNTKDYDRIIDVKALNITQEYKNRSKSGRFTNNGIKLSYKDMTSNENQITKVRASKDLLEIYSASQKDNIELGLRFHSALEALDLKNPNYAGLDSFICDKIKALTESDLFKNIKQAKIYQEYQFIDKNNDEELNGIIDLMLLYEDHIDIVDYKLSNIEDKAYIKQLESYRRYIKKISVLPINIYLYSILTNEIRKIEV